QLYLVASLKPWRRASLRFAEEKERLAAWLAKVESTAARDYELAIELALCRNLVKGYGDTHDRGVANYAPILGVLDRPARRPEAAKALAELRKAALADESGGALAAALARLGVA